MSKTQDTLEVLIKEHGAAHVASQVDNISKSMGRANAQQDRFEKGTSGMAKNATSSFAKMQTGLGGMVH